MWSLGDYGELATLLEDHAEALAAACDLRPGTTVLDVAAGNGNFAVAAARRGAVVTASDLTPRMVELGRARSQAAGLDVEWTEADAEDLPFPDGRFDVVASVFGAMFAPRPERVASELFRVARPGGLVAMANYGEGGFLGSFAALVAGTTGPPPVELPSPFLWGDAGGVRRKFAGLAASIDVTPRPVTFEFGSPDEALAFWERSNGPQVAIRTVLPPDRYREVRERAAGLIRELNRRDDGRCALESDCLLVLARKPA
jgi:SAM-dependent methyltransferase